MKRPLMIVSNRLPVQISEDNKQWSVKPGAGGLITALKPVLAQIGGDWIGWPGEAPGAPMDKLLAQVGEHIGCAFHGVELTRELVDGFYYGFSNETLWPLFHDLLGHATFEEEKWQAYCDVNRIFADMIAEQATEEHAIWVHDYQLILVADYLRKKGVRLPLAYFLHIPFPPPDIYMRLPWRREILLGLLAHDVIGFQGQRDRRNFAQCVRQLVPEAYLSARGELTYVHMPGGRLARFGAFPISIDFQDFDRRARSEEVQEAAWFIHEKVPDRQLMLGVDRLDYTKGIPAKFLAFERALEQYPELHDKLSLVQVVVPSRQQVPEYQRWKETIDQIVGRINGRFGHSGWMPLHYMYRSLTQEQLLGYYRTAEICLVTPLKDGMNLVCKEYAACQVEPHGVLILSEFAGAAPQMKDGALMVNPYDREGVARAIHQAFHMEKKERSQRMEKLRDVVRNHDVYRWVESFLDVVRRTL